MIELNKIICGDCIQILDEEIEEGSVDLVFADPPYGVSGKNKNLKWENRVDKRGDLSLVNESWDTFTAMEYIDFSWQWLKPCVKTLKDTGQIYICCSHQSICAMTLILTQLKFDIKNIIVWYKYNSIPNMTRKTYQHSNEFIIWGVKGSGYTFNYEKLKEINNGKQMRDVWELPIVQGKERLKDVDGKALHPTQKPEAMLTRIILASSNEDDLVLDPFNGVGTTTWIAKKLNRNFIGIEKDEFYCQVAKKRMAQPITENMF